jgi:hypothetical protein
MPSPVKHLSENVLRETISTVECFLGIDETGATVLGLREHRFHQTAHFGTSVW